ncbi:hypothetical protein [Streptomyces sp. NPDC047141]|uniref:hypothetical protein n=1 Tax=Streptomyces sp. NPDC047141 TaxID=3155738 RepID=UPI0033CABC9D
MRLPTIEGRTVFQLTDAVRFEVEKEPAPRGAEVTAFGHGVLDLPPLGPSDTKVLVQIRITTGLDGTAAVVEARPEAAYKRLDSAVWAIARVIDDHASGPACRSRGGRLTPDHTRSSQEATSARCLARTVEWAVGRSRAGHL